VRLIDRLMEHQSVMVRGGTLKDGVPVVQIRGRGFRGVEGTQFGGSYRSAGGYERISLLQFETM
jgi:hypothetical protein